jgi:hypothetical protein
MEASEHAGYVAFFQPCAGGFLCLTPAGNERTVWGDPAKFADHQFPFDRSMISKSAKPHESNR